jgi:4-hydroxybenzoate polyprenyltransferase
LFLLFFVTFVVRYCLCAFAPLRENINVRTTIRHLLELIRFSHTLFALPFALLAAVMAWRLSAFVAEYPSPPLEPFAKESNNLDNPFPKNFGGLDIPFRPYGGSGFSWQQLVGLLLCMVAARSFAMSFNRLADRRLDATNPRTAGRHLPAGILNVRQVTAFAIACAIVFIVSTLWFLPNWLPLALSVPVLAFLASYSFAKRFTWLAHFWLGTALALAPVAAWIALRGEAVIANPADLLPSLLLGGAVLTWVAGFDIIYACQDYDADIQAKLHSVPAKFGIPGALRIAAVCHMLTIVFLACLPLVYPLFGWIYWAGVAVVAVLLAYEHFLVRPDDLSRVNAAFFNVNAVISLGLFAVGSLDLWIRGG